MARKDLNVQKREAQERGTNAKFDAMHAGAVAEDARKEMQQISGVRAKAQEVSAGVNADIAEKRSKFDAWDEARLRRFNAKLDHAEAKLREWKATVDVKRAEEGMKEHDAIAELKQRAAVARARLAEWERTQYQHMAEEALGDAEHYFDKAYDAAASRYNM